MVRKLLRFSWIFSKPRKFSRLNFCSTESWHHEKIFPQQWQRFQKLSAKRLGSNLQKKLTRQWLAICFISDSLQLYLFSCDCMVILESVKSAYTCVSIVLSSISEYDNDSFKENSPEECKAFVETLVAVLQSWKIMNV